MRCIILNCSLKSGSKTSNTEALATEVQKELETQEITCEMIRIADYSLLPGVQTDEGEGDQWPEIHKKIIDSEILIIASPTWVGHPSSLAQRVLERMDAMISETNDEGLPVAYNKVAGVVVTGNEDGAHHVISEICGGLIDIGYTIPGQAWTYWNKGPGPGKSYLESSESKNWSITTGRTAASVLISVAKALKATPIPISAYKAGNEA